MANAPDSRRVALALLEQVWRNRRPLDEALAADRGFTRLPARDRTFARALVGTCLRRQGQIDALIDRCLERPLKAKRSHIRAILRLGAAQLCFLAVPSHAAVDTAVSLARGRVDGAFRGLVNAVLRRLGREGEALIAAQDAPRLNTPDWLWQSWTAAYGEATARRIAQAHLADPPLDLTVRHDPEAWAERLGASVLPGDSLRLPPGAGEVGRLAGYDEGAWWVQDVAASLPARLLGDVEGRQVLDLCAAPGGKTLQLAAAGAEVIAVDRSAPRLAQLRDNLARLGLSAASVAADATAWQPPAPAGHILLDAPCSATGTLRRHPDIAQLRGPEDVAAMTEVQDRLLDAAANMLAPGGILVYAVCSLQAEEGPARVDALLARRDSLARLPINPPEVFGLGELITADGDLRSLPCHLADAGGMDGFYACRLQRR